MLYTERCTVISVTNLQLLSTFHTVHCCGAWKATAAEPCLSVCVWLCQRQYESYLTVHTPPTPWTLFKNPLATCCLSLDLRVFQSVESHAHYDRKCHPVSMSSWEERVCVQLLLIEVELSSGIRLSAQLPELMLFGKENLMLEHISAANTQLSYGKLIPLIFLY